jgi:DUF1009 family protein
LTAPVGLVAGAGALPEVLARRIRASGRRLVCVQISGPADRLPGVCDRYASVPLPRALEALRLLREEGVEELVMAGKVDKLLALQGPANPEVRHLLEDADGRDPQLWKVVQRLLHAHGFRVLPPAAFLPDLVAGEGVLAGREPEARERRDLALGLRVAKQVAAAGVGQAVAVRGGVVLAVEAAEGTDAMIRRCKPFGPGAVVVKVAWPEADPGFDPPVVGPETLEAMREAGALVLGVETGATLVLDLALVRERARAWGVSVVGLRP